MRWPLLVLHVACGTLGMLSGFAAILLRKGSGKHALAGNIFAITMLTMAASGAILAAMKSEASNVIGGVLTFCLVATGWMTGRRGEWKMSAFDGGALLLTGLAAAGAFTIGLQASLSPSGMRYGDPAGSYFAIGSFALLAAFGDVRYALRGVIAGRQRLVRHLWRMCTAQFVAAASIFLARAELFPALLKRTGILWGLAFSPLAVMIFWMIRLRFTNRLVKVTRPRWPGRVESLSIRGRLLVEEGK